MACSHLLFIYFFIGGIEMVSEMVNIYSQLGVHLEKSINEFCFMRGISQGEISKDDYCKALNEVARSLGFKITVEAESSTVTSSKETPLEIINKTLCEMDLI